ncbi:MAG: ABC transporter ATP-binding protein [Acetobacteraceae bacterium]
MPPDDPIALLSVRGLRVSYGGAPAVDGVDLDIATGEIVGLTGESGSGKSALGLALLGLTRAPGRILDGTVVLDGTDLLSLGESALRKRRGRDIGLIVQNPRASLSPLHPVGEQIGATLRAHRPMTQASAHQRAVGLLRTLGLNDPERRAHAYPHEISGGMAQRVLIAMALGSGPRLLVADEPTSGLDVTIQAQFLDDMWRSAREAGSAVLLITQDLGIIANYCDRVLVLQAGRIVGNAPTRAFFAAPADAYSRTVLALRHEAPPEPIADAEAPLLKVQDLSKIFPLRRERKTLQAVDHVSFTIRRGETLGLVGESGSGKTTVGRALLRLVEPDGGGVIFDGRSVTEASPTELRRLRRRMQVVFQDPFDALDPRWSVAEILAEGLEASAGPGRIAELLNLVDLPPDTAKRRPGALSAGAQQRVSIARAIAVEPALIVLDEPTSALTPLARVGVIRLLRDLQARLGMSYLFISHDLSTVEHLSHRVAVMYLGQIVELGTRAQIFGAPLHPYSKALLAAHLTPDPSHRRVDRAVVEALSGEIPSPIDLPRGCYLAGRCPVAQPACWETPQALVPVADGRLVRCAPAAERHRRFAA